MSAAKPSRESKQRLIGVDKKQSVSAFGDVSTTGDSKKKESVSSSGDCKKKQSASATGDGKKRILSADITIVISQSKKKYLLIWPKACDVCARFLKLSAIKAVADRGTPTHSRWSFPAKNEIHVRRLVNCVLKNQDMLLPMLAKPVLTPDARDKMHAKEHPIEGDELSAIWALSGNDDPNDTEGPKLDWDPVDTTSRFRALLTEYIHSKFPSWLRRGDTIGLPDRYRNSCLWIYDGKTALDLEQDMDDYGHVPRSFPVITEFPISYWERTIDHNSFVFVDTRQLKVTKLTTHQKVDKHAYGYGESATSLATIEVQHKSPWTHKTETYLFTTGLFDVRQTKNGPQGLRKISRPGGPLNAEVLLHAFRKERWFSVDELGARKVLALPDTVNGVVGGKVRKDGFTRVLLF